MFIFGYVSVITSEDNNITLPLTRVRQIVRSKKVIVLTKCSNKSDMEIYD